MHVYVSRTYAASGGRKGCGAEYCCHMLKKRGKKMLSLAGNNHVTVVSLGLGVKDSLGYGNWYHYVERIYRIAIEGSQLSPMLSSHDHSGHTSPMCKMNMLFTWDATNTCVVFQWWHIKSNMGLLITMICLAVLGALYELLRVTVAALDDRGALTVSEKELKIQKAIGYAAQVGYSYFLMLVFMTYNGWIMMSVVVGAGIGHYLWGTKASKDLSCH